MLKLFRWAAEFLLGIMVWAAEFRIMWVLKSTGLYPWHSPGGPRFAYQGFHRPVETFVWIVSLHWRLSSHAQVQLNLRCFCEHAISLVSGRMAAIR